MTPTNSTAPEANAASQGNSWNRSRKIALALCILLVAFLVGYVPSSISSRSALQQNAELQRKLSVAELGGQLAMASYEANRNNYANATQFSIKFFDGLPRVISDTRDEAVKQQLQAMLARRTEIASNPAQPDPTLKEKLAAMCAEYFWVTQSGNKSGQ